MARTFIRQETQIRKSDTYDDTITPSLANYETNPVDIEDDLNTLRSAANNFLNRNGATFPVANWYDDLTAPSALDPGTERGINTLNSELHLLERKRVLVSVANLTDVTVGAGDNFAVLTLGQLPSNTTAAIGTVTTRGTVAAYNATFGAFSLAEVTGTTNIAPKNLCEIVDGATRDQILSSNRVVYALFQTESSTDGSTMTGTTPNRAQLSFVRINAAGDDLEAVPVADIAGKTINYASVERKALEDLNEQDFLRGAILDNAGATTVTRQIAYDNQGVTAVELGNNATLDVGTGLYWKIRDVLNADLLTITEGSTGGTTSVALGTDVDTFSSAAQVNDFVKGVTVDSGGSDIAIGVTAGSINTLGSVDLTVKGAGELYLNDGNQTGSTWTQVGIKLSDTTAEWDNFETNFSEVSILNALNQAYDRSRSPKVYTDIASPVSADTDVNVGTNMTYGTFLTSYDVYLNGSLLRPGANSAANNDYYPGTTATDLKFEFVLKPGDVICVIPYANA